MSDDVPPTRPGPTTPKVVAGFFSFTEVEAGAHRSYNEWHLFDHLPEQFVLAGVAGGWRWVRTPALAARSAATPPLDRTHYVTLYLLAGPLDRSLVEFQEHGVALARAGRFHQQRTSHLAGPLLVESQLAAPRALVAPAAVPFRPGTGVHVRVLSDDLDPGAAGPTSGALLDVPGVAGVWTFAGAPPDAPGPFAGALAGLRVTCAWLDGDPAEVDAALAATCPAPRLPEGGPSGFVGTLATIDPDGPFDWFDR